MKSILSLALLVLAGCTGPMTYRQAKLPDGGEIRTYHSGAFLAPSVTVVAYRAPGVTNWALPNTFSGQGLIGAASTGGGIAAAGAFIRPSNSGSTVNTVQNATQPKPATPSKKYHK